MASSTSQKDTIPQNSFPRTYKSKGLGRETWADREEVAKWPAGAWMLREAAKVLGVPEEAVDKLLRP
ncbi:hypothetical protein [Ovoidimarina sediminis]|uniref:hypothetical protein n=1 Tax=Ovoidimarina sediminis TaxID=3079856 RepID=UPI00292EEDC4|nr:hypothetical protein [Rhodophyticola sp. MJ-SS7]